MENKLLVRSALKSASCSFHCIYISLFAPFDEVILPISPRSICERNNKPLLHKKNSLLMF